MAPSQLDLGLGALEISVGLCCFLVGVVTLQTFNYFREFSTDPWPIRLLVAIVYFFDVIHSAFLMHTVYSYSVTHYGHAEVMASSVWTLNTSIIFQGLVALCVQSFFCLRIWKISRSRILSGICLSLTIARFCMSSIVVSYDFKYYSFAVIQTRYKTFVAATLAVIATSDVAIGASMVGSLLRQKTGFSSTNKLIDKIIGFVIATGLLTSILAVVDVITFVTMENFIWLGLLIIIVKVYTNSLLASLNERYSNRRTQLTFDTSLSKASMPNWRKPADASTTRNAQEDASSGSLGFVTNKNSTFELAGTDTFNVQIP